MKKDSVEAYDLPSRVATYDADMDVMHPLRGKMIEIALELLPFAADYPLRALDLGVGTGIFARCLLERYPNAQLVAVDGAASMLDLAKSRLAGLADRVEWVVADFRELPPEIVESERFDAVLSAYALHHLNASEKRDALRRVVGSMVPGGWLLNADLVVSVSPQVEQRIQQLRVAGVTQRAERGDARFCDPGATRRTLDELEAQESDQPQTLETDLRLLREAGLASAEVFWREYREAVTGGPKL